MAGLCRILASSSCARMSPAVQKLADDYFNWRLANKPEFASFVGIHDYDDQLDDMSLEAYQSRYDQCQVFFHQAEALEAIVTDHDDQVNIRALKNELITYMDGFPYQGDDYEKLLSRYEKLPEQLKQIQMLMETGVTTGNVNHAISMKSVVEGLERFVVDVAEDSPLWMPFTTFPDNFNREQIADFKERANAIILDKISPGFQQLRDYVKNDYVTRPDIAVTSLPDGEAQYNQLIKLGLLHKDDILNYVDKGELWNTEFRDACLADPSSFEKPFKRRGDQLHPRAHVIHCRMSSTSSEVDGRPKLPPVGEHPKRRERTPHSRLPVGNRRCIDGV
ncbi:hypothetical protein Hamer_G010921, partial [Homarus americanus]